jgi:hypothetical protein
MYSKDVLEAVDRHLKKFKLDNDESLLEKIFTLKQWKEWCQRRFKYFDPNNAIQFMTKARFWLKSSGKLSRFPFQKIELNEYQSTYLAQAISLRRELFEAIYIRVKNAYEELTIRHQGPKKYQLKTDNPSFDLMELYLALVSSNTIEFVQGDKETLLMDLFNLFNVEPGRVGYTKGKILERLTPSQFVDRLAESLEIASKEKKKSTIKKI